MSTSLTVERADWQACAAPQVDRALWSAVIAAAGKGSRLGYDHPKILFPVAGRSILEWLLRLLLPNCQTAVFVLSPEGRSEIEPELERLAPGRYQIAIQPVPTGMGDAVDIGAAAVATPQTVVLWGDQVAIRPASLEAILRLHQGSFAPDLTIPTVFRPEPYIHFERDQDGSISALKQAREGDAMPPTGESDTGLFCFRTSVLRSLLAKLRTQPAAQGRATAEFNLLPVIPFAARNGFRVLTPHLMAVEETVGINAPSDAVRIEPFLRNTET
jgi:bifunctional UDP-N-acetylglucosamine pyrophosphorylase/glucosamine-1-phosphate N-acetyltransferase